VLSARLRLDSSLHFRELRGGGFTDEILDTGVNAGWADAVSLFQAPDGNTAIAFLGEEASGNLRLTYIEVPEPGPELLFVMASLGWLRSRKRDKHFA
jgi:hypothetical protein